MQDMVIQLTANQATVLEEKETSSLKRTGKKRWFSFHFCNYFLFIFSVLRNPVRVFSVKIRKIFWHRHCSGSSVR